jgi:hypothetical protein
MGGFTCCVSCTVNDGCVSFINLIDGVFINQYVCCNDCYACCLKCSVCLTRQLKYCINLLPVDFSLVYSCRGKCLIVDSLHVLIAVIVCMDGPDFQSFSSDIQNAFFFSWAPSKFPLVPFGILGVMFFYILEVKLATRALFYMSFLSLVSCGSLFIRRLWILFSCFFYFEVSSDKIVCHFPFHSLGFLSSNYNNHSLSVTLILAGLRNLIPSIFSPLILIRSLRDCCTNFFKLSNEFNFIILMFFNMHVYAVYCIAKFTVLHLTQLVQIFDFDLYYRVDTDSILLFIMIETRTYFFSEAICQSIHKYFSYCHKNVTVYFVAIRSPLYPLSNRLNLIVVALLLGAPFGLVDCYFANNYLDYLCEITIILYLLLWSCSCWTDARYNSMTKWVLGHRFGRIVGDSSLELKSIAVHPLLCRSSVRDLLSAKLMLSLGPVRIGHNNNPICCHTTTLTCL